MGGKNIQAQPDPELRDRFDRFKDDLGYENDSQATRKLVDEGLRANGYGPNGSASSSILIGLKGAGAALVLFALGLFGFGALAPPAITVVTGPFAFSMVAAGGGLLFVATVWEAARERRLPGIRYGRGQQG